MPNQEIQSKFRLKFNSIYSFLVVALTNINQLYAEPFVQWLGQSPTESQITAIPPSPVKPKLSFQTRISQATLPILEGVVYNVEIKYKNLLSTGDCSEKFENVRIIDSVLNLELGQNARCDFGRAIAQRSSLNLELCFSLEPNEESTSTSGQSSADLTRCFNRQVEISSVPYAIKVTRALEGQSAHQANYSFMSSYAYRVVDQGGRLAESRVPAHFSFATKPPQGLGLGALGLTSDSNEAIEEISEAGYVRWHPENGGEGSDFYIARLPFGFLKQLTFGAHLVDWYGHGQMISPTQLLENTTEASPELSLSVRENMQVTGNLKVSAGRAVVQKRSTISEGILVDHGGLYVDGSARFAQSLNATDSFEQGWRSPNLNLETHSPNYLFRAEAIQLIGRLTLEPLKQSSLLPNPSADLNSVLNTNSLTVNGPARLVALSSSQVADIAQIRVANHTVVSGSMEISQGHLEIESDLSIDGSLEVKEHLNLGSKFELLRNGSPQAILNLSDESLSINIDSTNGEANPIYDELHFKGDVQFANRVQLSSSISGIDSECSIVPARVKSGVDRGKEIPNVVDLTCGSVTIRVSALLESDCGNGVREGEEICDYGPGNTLEYLQNYCEESTTPFDNCNFFRLANIAPANCTTPLQIAVPFSQNPIEFSAALFNGQCALQSPRDDETENFSICFNNDCQTAAVTYPRMFCRADCTFARCGDGIYDKRANEACDDGNFNDNDDCNNACEVVTSCKLKVAERVSGGSSLTLVDTTLPSDLGGIDPSTEEGRLLLNQFFSRAECPSVSTPHNAPQKVVEVDLDEPTWLTFETYPYTQTQTIHSPLHDTFLYVRENCEQVYSDLCNDDGGLEFMSKIDRRLYPAGRHYVVVSGYGNYSGASYLGVKHTCAQEEKLFASILHRASDPDKGLVFQINTNQQGRIGHVQTDCLASIPDPFIQPTSPEFVATEARSGLGLHQVAIELVLERESQVSVSADSQTIDPVIYIKNGCESRSTVRSKQDPTILLCNDNATGNPLFPVAQVSSVMAAGVYYIIVDSDSLVGGPVNVSLNVQNVQ